MGKRGPQPTPTAILKLRGSWRADARNGEPVTDGQMPKCPPWLEGDSRKLWYQVVRYIKSMNLIATTDVGSIARYCEYFVKWVELSKNPARSETAFNNYANQLNRFEQCFGLTPSARAGLKTGMEQKQDDDPFERLMNRKA